MITKMLGNNFTYFKFQLLNTLYLRIFLMSIKFVHSIYSFPVNLLSRSLTVTNQQNSQGRSINVILNLCNTKSNHSNVDGIGIYMN